MSAIFTTVSRLRDEVIFRADIPVAEQNLLWYYTGLLAEFLDLDDILTAPPSEQIRRLRIVVHGAPRENIDEAVEYARLTGLLEERLPELSALAEAHFGDLQRRDQIAAIQEQIQLQNEQAREEELGRIGRRFMAVARLVKPAPEHKEECSIC